MPMSGPGQFVTFYGRGAQKCPYDCSHIKSEADCSIELQPELVGKRYHWRVELIGVGETRRAKAEAEE